MNHLWLIIKREYINKIRNKSFVVMTFVSPIIVIALGILIGYLNNLNNDTVRTITILDKSSSFSHTFKQEKNTKFDYVQGSLENAKKVTLEKGNYGLLYIPNRPIKELKNQIEFFSEESPSIQFMQKITDKLEETAFNLNLSEEGIKSSQITMAKMPIDIQLENYTGEKTSKLANLIKLFFGGAAGYLLMMFIIIYGNMIMRSVIEEKTNRIVEIIISSVKPIQLMMGKILGTSLAGVTQFLIWLIFGGLLMFILTEIFKVSPSSANDILLEKSGMDKMISEVLIEFFHFPIMTLVVSFLLYFLGGYFLYSSLYAAIGASVDSETDTQQFLFPVLLPLMLGIYVGFFTVIEDPHGTVSTLFSYIPFTSPIVMLMRIPFGVSWWEVAISLLILYGTFLLIIWIAAKIYRVGILMYGKKPSYKEIFKWLWLKY